jgi:hypothetical protein
MDMMMGSVRCGKSGHGFGSDHAYFGLTSCHSRAAKGYDEVFLRSTAFRAI